MDIVQLLEVAARIMEVVHTSVLMDIMDISIVLVIQDLDSLQMGKIVKVFLCQVLYTCTNWKLHQ